MRVLAGESGVAVGGSIGDLSRQIDTDRAFNDQIAKLNLGNNLLALSTGTQAQQTQLESQRQNPLVNGLLGGLSGLLLILKKNYAHMPPIIRIA